MDDPINKYLPFEVVNQNHPNQAIIIRQLATHSSSIIDTDIYMQTDYINKDDIAIAENLKEKYELYYQNPSKEWIPLSKYLEKLLDKKEHFTMYQLSLTENPEKFTSIVILEQL